MEKFKAIKAFEIHFYKTIKAGGLTLAIIKIFLNYFMKHMVLNDRNTIFPNILIIRTIFETK